MSKTQKRVILFILLIGTAIAINYSLGLAEYLSLQTLKNGSGALKAFYEQSPRTAALGFVGVYILVVTLCLPGTLILTLAGGAIFGTLWGSVAVIVGSIVGATLAFLASRFLIGDWVNEKFGERLKPLNEGFSKNAINYIIFIRLVPIIPYTLVNLLCGLTQIPVRTYFFGTLIGDLPGAVIFVNAGNALTSINSLKDVASLNILFAFILIGLFALIPVFYKWKKTKNYSPATFP